MLGFLIPLVAIGLASTPSTASINRRTLRRILAQPIYRDALLLGKFVAGLAHRRRLVTPVAAVIGLGLLTLGVPPSSEEVCARWLPGRRHRLWRRLARGGDAVLGHLPLGRHLGDGALGLWLFLSILWPVLVPAIAQAFVSPENEATLLVTAQALARLSPSTLFGECVLALLDPTTRTLGPVYLSQLQGAVMGAPIPLGDSVMVAWPQIVGLVAASILLFVSGYVAFQRQEVRA